MIPYCGPILPPGGHDLNLNLYYIRKLQGCCFPFWYRVQVRQDWENWRSFWSNWEIFVYDKILTKNQSLFLFVVFQNTVFLCFLINCLLTKSTSNVKLNASFLHSIKTGIYLFFNWENSAYFPIGKGPFIGPKSGRVTALKLSCKFQLF